MESQVSVNTGAAICFYGYSCKAQPSSFKLFVSIWNCDLGNRNFLHLVLPRGNTFPLITVWKASFRNTVLLFWQEWRKVWFSYLLRRCMCHKWDLMQRNRRMWHDVYSFAEYSVYLLYPGVFLSQNPLASLLLTVIPIHSKVRCHGLSVLFTFIQVMLWRHARYINLKILFSDFERKGTINCTH